MTDADVEEKLIVVTAPRARGALDDNVARLINDGLALYEQVGEGELAAAAKQCSSNSSCHSTNAATTWSNTRRLGR
jgi:hypothetical protein